MVAGDSAKPGSENEIDVGKEASGNYYVSARFFVSDLKPLLLILRALLIVYIQRYCRLNPQTPLPCQMGQHH